MVIFLGIFLIADVLVLLATNFRYVPGAVMVCDAVAPLCNYPVPMFVLGIIAAGLVVLQQKV
jgi:hypothetical protein